MIERTTTQVIFALVSLITGNPSLRLVVSLITGNLSLRSVVSLITAHPYVPQAAVVWRAEEVVFAWQSLAKLGKVKLG